MKVVIDAGHGGSDPGATFDGAVEKNITLDIALELERMLEPSCIKTVMTRRADVMVPLGDRTTIANMSRADFLVSIHTNADPDPDKPGMPEAKGQEIWIDQTKHDRPLALAIASGLMAEFPDEPWRDIRQRDLWMVHKSNMPACLVEVAFIDNSESVRKLRDAKVRQSIAFAIMRGILTL